MSWLYDCHLVRVDENGAETIRYSNAPMLNINISLGFELLCILLLTLIRVSKMKFKRISRNYRYRNYLLYTCAAIQITITTLSAFTNTYLLYCSYFIRPVVVLTLLSAVRKPFLDVFRLLKEVVVILLVIFGFVLFNSVLFFAIFDSTTEGYMIFPTIWETYYKLLIYLTACNFPDVMLPAYNVNYVYAWFFVVYFILA